MSQMKSLAGIALLSLSGTAALAQAPAPLNITTNGAQQQIEIEVGPITGEVRLYGIPGRPSGELVQNVSEFSLTTGNAQDFVEVRIFAETAMPITINTRSGVSDVKVLYDLPASAPVSRSEVTVRGGRGTDTVVFEALSLSADMKATWRVFGGEGTNTVIATVISPEPTDALQLDLFGEFGAGIDTLEANVTTYALANSLNVSGAMGAGNDALKVNLTNLGDGSAVSTFAIDLGAGADTYEGNLNGSAAIFDSLGTVLGGGGSDELKHTIDGASGDFSLTLDGGAANDNIDVTVKGAYTGTPRQLGQAGNDFLKLTIDGPDIAGSFIDGGLGIDYFSGVAATILNVEQIN